MLNPRQIQKNKSKLSKLEQDVQQASLYHYICSDPTRLRMMYLLKTHAELCPSDICSILDLSPSAVSHQLKTLEHLQLLKSIKMGKMICYGLSRKGKRFVKRWIKF